MVFFTCNKCGDSLKKKDCANHAGRCYPLALTCVDCHKDFFGNDFVAHTSCLTEAEKYGVKGFVSRAPSTAGAAKQDEWTCAILSASKISDLMPGHRRFLEILTRYGNVPRKKKPFQNFARNLSRDNGRNLDLLDQVFGIVESEFQKIKAPPKANSSSQAKAEDTEGVKGTVNKAAELVVDGTTNKESEGKKEEAIDESYVKAVARSDVTKDVVCEDTSTSTKKRKKKHKEEVIDGIKELKENDIMSIPEENSNDTICKKSKKKKHKKHRSLEAEDEVIKNGNGTLEELVHAENDSMSAKSTEKKKKKHKKSAEPEEVTGNATLEEPVTAEDDSTSAKSKTKKKKKHKKSAEAEVVTNNGNDALEEPIRAEDDSASVKMKRKSKEKLDKVDETGSIDIVDLPKKSKKAKHKKHEENVEETVENVNDQNETPSKDAAKKSKKKKLKLQDVEECAPRKKTKTTSG